MPAAPKTVHDFRVGRRFWRNCPEMVTGMFSGRQKSQRRIWQGRLMGMKKPGRAPFFESASVREMDQGVKD